MPRLVGLAPWMVAAVTTAVAVAVAPAAVLGYDAMFHVLWGSDLAAGRLPVYDTLTAPTPHPLQMAAALALAPLGEQAADAFRALHLLSLGGLGAGLVVLGRTLYGLPAGVLAAVLVVGQPYVVTLAHRGQADVPALAFVVWAAALEAARPRRGAAVLALLAVAGLLRPEAWLLAGAYLVWLLPRRTWPQRVRLGLLAAAGPVLWVLMDLLITGDPLWSFSHTAEITERIGRRTGLTSAVRVGGRSALVVLGPAVLVAGSVGLVLCSRRLLRDSRVPLALVVVGGAAFVLLAVAQLSLQPRYLLVAFAGLGLLAAAAALGWVHRQELDGRLLRVVSALVLLLLAGGALARATEVRDGQTALAADDRSLYEVLETDAVRTALLACDGPVGVGHGRLVPYVADALDVPSQDVALVPPRAALYVSPASTASTSLGGGVPGVARVYRAADDAAPGYEVIVETRDWHVSQTC